jgi:ABC-type molybdate transport system permease subunit
MLPFVTLSRTLPTAILMALIAVFLLPCIFLVPVTVAFFVVFPMMYESITNAVNNVGKKQIEMANIFKVSK